MPNRRRATSSKKRSAAQRAPETPLKENAPVSGRVIERPDGFYWESLAKKGETRGGPAEDNVPRIEDH
jgi:hypothetical protein